MSLHIGYKHGGNKKRLTHAVFHTVSAAPGYSPTGKQARSFPFLSPHL